MKDQDVKIYSPNNLPKHVKDSKICGVLIGNSSFATMQTKISHLIGIPDKEEVWAGVIIENSPTIEELLDLWFKQLNSMGGK